MSAYESISARRCIVVCTVPALNFNVIMDPIKAKASTLSRASENSSPSPLLSSHSHSSEGTDKNLPTNPLRPSLPQASTIYHGKDRPLLERRRGG
jgi:hypothetical protein